MICFSTLLSGGEEGSTRTLPQARPTYAEPGAGTAQETLRSWAQLTGESIGLSCFTPEECGMESNAAFSSTVQDSSFPNLATFPILLMKGQNGNWECELVLQVCAQGTSAFRWMLLRLGVGSHFFLPASWPFSNLWMSNLYQNIMVMTFANFKGL